MIDMDAIEAMHQAWGATAEQDVGDALRRYSRIDFPVLDEEDLGDPPAWGERGGFERLDFEETLGRYDAGTATVTIWPSGIKRAAEMLGTSEIFIERIVKLHEFAHALHHRGVSRTQALPNEAAAILQRQDISFRAMAMETGEQVAQLATLVAIRLRRDRARHAKALATLDGLVDAFLKLMDRQSRPYRLPLACRDMDVRRLQEKLSLIVDMTESGMSPSADHIKRILD